MPKQSIDYSNTVIYKLVCKDISISDLYIGHTTQFTKRKSYHKKSCKCKADKAYNYYVYQFIRAHGGMENWDMIEVEIYPCENKNEACIRERYWMETLCATLNKVIPTRTLAERIQDTKVERQAISATYRLNNKETIARKNKEYYEKNKITINEKRKEYSKEYIEKNKDIIRLRGKEYSKKNRAKINERLRLYRANNKDKFREYNKRAREKRKNVSLRACMMKTVKTGFPNFQSRYLPVDLKCWHCVP